MINGAIKLGIYMATLFSVLTNPFKPAYSAAVIKVKSTINQKNRPAKSVDGFCLMPMAISFLIVETPLKTLLVIILLLVLNFQNNVNKWRVLFDHDE